MIRKYLKKTCLIVLFSLSSFAEEYSFRGKHFIASYGECDLEALTCIDGLIEAMRKAVQASGATILNSSFYEFPGNALTMVFLLSESHASIHTYPEHGSCFIDLFTCGDHCSYEGFHSSLAAYLNPKKIDQKLLIREQTIEEESL